MDANTVVVSLLADVDNLTQNSAQGAANFEGSMKRIEDAATKAENSVGRIGRAFQLSDLAAPRREVEQLAETVVGSAGAIRFATRDLGFQISDIGTQLAGGQSPFLIFAQQGPQVANAISEISAAGAGLGTVLSGVALPAILAIISVIGVLASKSDDAADATHRHAAAAKSTEDAIHDLDIAMGKAIQTTQQEAQAHYDTARALFAEEVKTRNLTIAKLEQAKAERLAAGRVGGLGGGSGGAALPNVAASNNVDEQQALLDKQNRAIVEGARTIAEASIPIVMQQVKEATDAAAAAQGKYERSLGSLNEQYKKTKDIKAYRAALADITRTRDAEIEAANKHERAHRGLTDAQREAAKAAREEQKAQEELQRVFDALTKALDPATANLDEYRQRLADIDRLVRAGKFTPDQAADLKGRALDRFIDTDEATSNAELEKHRKEVLGSRQYALGYGVGEAPSSLSISDDKKGLEEAYEAGPFGKKAYDEQERNIRSLAQIYQQAFTGGAKGIGDALRRELQSAVAQALARLTISKLGNLLGDGGALSGVGKFLGFGRAGGGYVAPGQTVRVNEQSGGMELLRMGSEGGTVIPLGSARAANGGGGTVINQTIQYAGAVDIADKNYVNQMGTVIAAQTRVAINQKGQQILNAAPARVQQKQVLGS